jgi:hypothetical protein
LLWFDPLVHLTNRLLDAAREGLCDNYALRVASSTEYARTLLTVARWVSQQPGPVVATTLFGSAGKLENRVAHLLLPRRNTMTHLKAWKSVAIALAFFSGVYVLTAMAAPPTAKNEGFDLSHRVDFKVGATSLREGDQITIDEVVGTANTIAAGNLYLIKGSYRLGSEKSATLAAYVTTSQRESTPSQNTQHMLVGQGEGRFSLFLYVWSDGNPHLSFYPAAGGGSFASVYFGTGKSLLTRGWWERTEKSAAK